MTISIDLNAFPLPEVDEVEIFRGLRQEEKITQKERSMETALQIYNREREERRARLKRKYPAGPGDERQNNKMVVVQSAKQDPVLVQTRINKLPPDGWLDCPPYGEPIGYIIPSKVPLDESYNGCIEDPGKRYSCRQVIHDQQSVFRRELGLVIDLTYSKRYYSPSEWIKQGIRHVKIACVGKDSVPDEKSVNRFVYEVMEFYSRRQMQSKKKYILVHCTHGHNRTGYMIVHFLMRSKSISVTEALDIFSKRRPPGIYKQDYIDSLYAFYHEKKPETLICPTIPEWKISSSDIDINSEAVQGGSTSTVAPSQQGSHDEKHIVMMTNDDKLGDDEIPDEQQHYMRQFCYNVLKLGSCPRQVKDRKAPPFPGSHPVSLDRENLQLLRQRYYHATWKADGTRYMMLITSHGCYLIDRDFQFRRVQMRFPLKQTNGVRALFKDTHHFTLLDGEMVIDLPNTHEQVRRYLIYDIIAINGVPVIERPFCERWKLIEKEVIEPRKLESDCISLSQKQLPSVCRSGNPSYRYDMEPFKVRRKDFWLLSTIITKNLLKEFIPKLPHAADGLIFQGWYDTYVPRTDQCLLKWKYPEMNSVDFLFEVVNENCQSLFLNDRARKTLIMEGNNVVVFKNVDDDDPSKYSGKVIECSWDSQEQVWVFMRIRTDKSIPNELCTYQKVMRSITDNITEEVLVNEIGEIIRLPMYADRIRIDREAYRNQLPR